MFIMLFYRNSRKLYLLTKHKRKKLIDLFLHFILSNKNNELFNEIQFYDKIT